MSQNEMTQGDYWREVDSIVESLLEECRDDKQDREGLDERLWETIDGHQWVIYTAYNFDVLRHSQNDGYTVENFWVEGRIVTDAGMNWAALAFGALYGDVSERLWDRVEDCDPDFCLGDACLTCHGCGWVDSSAAVEVAI